MIIAKNPEDGHKKPAVDAGSEWFLFHSTQQHDSYDLLCCAAVISSSGNADYIESRREAGPVARVPVKFGTGRV